MFQIIKKQQGHEAIMMDYVRWVVIDEATGTIEAGFRTVGAAEKHVVKLAKERALDSARK